MFSALVSSSAQGTEAATESFLDSFPVLLDGLWVLLADLPLVWAVGLVGIAFFARRRRGLVRDQLLAGVIAALVAALSHRVVEASWPSLDELLGTRGPPPIPPASSPSRWR